MIQAVSFSSLEKKPKRVRHLIRFGFVMTLRFASIRDNSRGAD